MVSIPASALNVGFNTDLTGTHTSRTMMLAELRLLLAACPPATELEGYRRAVVEENVLLKKTESTRRGTFRFLRELYALDTHTLLFRALRELWEADSQAQPLLALLCALARDPLPRSTGGLIMATPQGTAVTPQMLSAAVDESFPDHYMPKILAKIGRNTASTWSQSGHLAGRLTKVRARAVCRTPAVAYALLLGYLCEARGQGLFHTLWTDLLDTSTGDLHSQALMASQRGWLEYRHSGEVTDISFRHLLRKEG